MTDPADRTRAFQHFLAAGGKPPVVRRCPDCRGYIGPKHRETCPGPRQVVAPWPPEPEPACECPPGAWHDPGCELVA